MDSSVRDADDDSTGPNLNNYAAPLPEVSTQEIRAQQSRNFWGTWIYSASFTAKNISRWDGSDVPAKNQPIPGQP